MLIYSQCRVAEVIALELGSGRGVELSQVEFRELAVLSGPLRLKVWPMDWKALATLGSLWERQDLRSYHRPKGSESRF